MGEHVSLNEVWKMRKRKKKHKVSLKYLATNRSGKNYKIIKLYTDKRRRKSFPHLDIFPPVSYR